MTDKPLSPAAQAVFDAVKTAQPDYEGLDTYEACFDAAVRAEAAAALRAAADAVAPVAMPHRRKVRDELMTIANELEAGR